LPYLLLTIAVAVLGIFIATQLVAGSLQERFSNQLIDAGRVAADGLIRLERDHLELWRVLAVTDGLADAVQAGDGSQARLLIEGQTANRAMDSVQLVDANDRLVLSLDRTPAGSYNATGNTSMPSWEPLDRALRGERDAAGDKFSGILYQVGQPYLFTVGPLQRGGTVVGALMIGTRLDNALRTIGAQAVAKVSAYDLKGELLGSTLPLAESNDPPNRLTADQVNQIISRARPSGSNAPPEALLTSLRRGSSDYRLAFGPLQIRQAVIGAYSVALESNFIVDSTVTSRLTFALVFVVMTVAVFGIGLAVSRRLIIPISRLVSTSQAVASGNLNQRTGLTGGDELGVLAHTFDNMTQKLQERTRDLEALLQAHREEAFKIRAILSSIADGVLVIDSHGRIIMMNNAAERILGDMAHDFSAGMLREQPTVQLGTLYEVPAGALSADEVRRFEINQRVISAHAGPVITDDGQLLGTVVVLRDITREAEIDRLKDAFIEQVSHELRTPLTAVKGYSDLMLQTAGGQVPDKYMEFLTIINRHADSLVTMITELLDISQMEAKSMSLRLERIDLNELVGATVDEWRDRIIEKGLRLEVRPDPQGTSIVGDRRRLNWAIKQLVSNAYHYTDPGGRIEVSVAANSETASIAVKDTGIGITPEDQKYLFTRFFRSTTRIHSNERGVGLGLYIVKAVAEAHRGKIEVDSQVGQGSTFRLMLPLDELEGEPPILSLSPDSH
jgi:two-component system phosphate regulon sensor histidine kinase PhoR